MGIMSEQNIFAMKYTKDTELVFEAGISLAFFVVNGCSAGKWH
jgi:hypothetical protein